MWKIGGVQGATVDENLALACCGTPVAGWETALTGPVKRYMTYFRCCKIYDTVARVRLAGRTVARGLMQLFMLLTSLGRRVAHRGRADGRMICALKARGTSSQNRTCPLRGGFNRAYVLEKGVIRYSDSISSVVIL